MATGSPGQVAAPRSGLGTYMDGPMPFIVPGASVDLAFNASGGAVVSAGPFQAGIVQLAVIGGGANGVRGSGSAAPVGTVGGTPNVLTLLPSGGMIHAFGIAAGNYVNVVSNDASTGILNITQAL